AGDAAVEVRVRASRTAGLGLFRTSIAVRTQSSAPLRASIPLQGRIVSRIPCEPSALVLRATSAPSPGGRSVEVFDRSGASVDVDSVRVEPTGVVEAKRDMSRASGRGVVIVSLPGGRAVSRPIEAQITCILRGYQRVAIPVMILPR